MKNLLLTFVSVFWLSFGFSQGSGKLLDYNGSSSYVTCGSINLSGYALTLQAWIKVDAFKSGHPYITSIVGTEIGNNQANLRIGDASLDKEKLQFILYINGRHSKLNGSTKLKTGIWYHVAATYNGSTMKIYINGILDVSMSVSGPISCNSTFEIGRNYSNSRIMDGQIDEVSVFKGALSQATIRKWMCQSIKSSHPNYSTLEGYWTFDKGSGSTATDHSTKSHNGSLQGSPSWLTSSAAIGDTSISDYTSPLSVKMAHANGDSMVVNNVIGAASSVHLYLVNKKPNNTTFPSGVSVYDTTRYWGVFYADGSSPKGNIAYHYQNNSHFKGTGSCMLDLAQREHNAKTSWTAVNATQSSSALSKSGESRSEYILIYRSNKVINKDSAKTICDGDSILLKHNTSGLTYKWFKNNVLINGANTNSYQAKTIGTYWLEASLGNCTDTSYSFNLTTKPKPNVSLASISPSCPDVLYDTLSGGSPAGGIYLNTYVSGNLFVVKTAGPGTHKILYQYTDSVGCSDTASQMKTVHGWPAVSLSGIPKMCADSNTFTLSNGTPSGGTYFVNGAQNTSFDATSLGAGKHTVRYNYTDTNSCKNADSIDVTVVKLPVVVLTLIKKRACEYENPLQLDGQNPRGGLYSGTGVNGFNYEPKTAGPGKHPVTYTYTDANTGCSNFAVDTFTVVAKPATPVVTQVADSLKSTPADVYLWYDAADNRQSGNNQSYQPPKNGKYYVIIKVDGCQSDKSELVDYIKTGIQAFGNNVGLRIYPSPANSILKIESNKGLTVNLLDMNGRVVYNGQVNSNLQIPVSNFNSGVYILELSSGNELKRRRVIIEH